MKFLLCLLSIYIKIIDTKLKRNAFDVFDPIRQSNYTFIEGHRGVNRELEQNTLISFQKSIEYNLDSIELDVWLTQDKVPVIIHAGDLGEIEENTNGKGKINQIPSQAFQGIQSIKMNQTIPTLEEVMRLCKDKIFVNIEIKDNSLNEAFSQIIKLVEKYEMHNQIAISSFNHGYYELVQNYIRNKGKISEFGLLYDEYFTVIGSANTPFAWNISGVSYNIYQKDVSFEFVEKAHKNGNSVMAWFKMTDEENEKVYERLMRSGVDVICCNEPTKAIEYRNRRQTPR